MRRRPGPNGPICRARLSLYHRRPPVFTPRADPSAACRDVSISASARSTNLQHSRDDGPRATWHGCGLTSARPAISPVHFTSGAARDQHSSHHVNACRRSRRRHQQRRAGDRQQRQAQGLPGHHRLHCRRRRRFLALRSHPGPADRYAAGARLIFCHRRERLPRRNDPGRRRDVRIQAAPARLGAGSAAARTSCRRRSSPFSARAVFTAQLYLLPGESRSISTEGVEGNAPVVRPITGGTGPSAATSVSRSRSCSASMRLAASTFE